MPTYNPDCMEVLVADISMKQPIGIKGTCQGRLPYNLKVFFFLTCSVTQLCPTLWDPMDCSPPGSSAHGIFQVRILERVAISFSRTFSRPRDQAYYFCFYESDYLNSPYKWTHIVFVLLWSDWLSVMSSHFFNNFYWRIVDLQCCISSKCTAKWLSYTYTCSHSVLDSSSM